MLFTHFVGDAARHLLCQFGSIGTHVSRIGFNPGHEACLIECSIAAPTIGFAQQLEYARLLEAAAHRQGFYCHRFPVFTLGTQRLGRDYQNRKDQQPVHRFPLPLWGETVIPAAKSFALCKVTRTSLLRRRVVQSGPYERPK